MHDADTCPGQPRKRRRRLARVIALATVVLLPAATLLSGTAQYVPIALIPSLLVVPMVLFGESPPPPEQSDGENGGGGGGSRRPDPPRGLPSGGLPLPFCQQARRRYWGTARTTLIPPRARRPAREPVRPQVPTHAG